MFVDMILCFLNFKVVKFFFFFILPILYICVSEQIAKDFQKYESLQMQFHTDINFILLELGEIKSWEI